MEIRRVTTISALTSDGKEMEVGKTYIYDTRVGCFIGIYKGLTPRRVLMFDGLFGKQEAEFRVSPECVFTIYEAAAEIKTEGTA